MCPCSPTGTTVTDTCLYCDLYTLQLYTDSNVLSLSTCSLEAQQALLYQIHVFTSAQCTYRTVSVHNMWMCCVHALYVCGGMCITVCQAGVGVCVCVCVCGWMCVCVCVDMFLNPTAFVLRMFLTWFSLVYTSFIPPVACVLTMFITNCASTLTMLITYCFFADSLTMPL